MFISGLGLLTKNIILKLRRKDAQYALGMRNSTGSPLFADFKSDLSRAVRSRPLAKGTKTLGTRVLPTELNNDCACVICDPVGETIDAKTST